MPNFTTIAVGESLASLGALTRVSLISIDIEGESQINVNRIGTVVPLRMSSTGDSLTLVTRLYPTAIIVAPTGDGDVFIRSLQQEEPVVLGMVVEGTSDIFIAGTRVSLVVVAAGEGLVIADFAPYFPPIREPGTGEIRGAINYLWNTSFEAGAGAHLLMTSVAGGTTRSLSTARHVHGLSSGLFGFTGVVDQTGRVFSRNLFLAGGKSYVGSTYLSGTMAGLFASLRIEYTDASVDVAEGDEIILATAVDEFIPMQTPPILTDPLKTIQTVGIEFRSSTAFTGDLYVDAIQVEEDFGGASPYVHGDFPGHRWLGEREVSPAIRETMVA
jgi:hypothetical protein